MSVHMSVILCCVNECAPILEVSQSHTVTDTFLIHSFCYVLQSTVSDLEIGCIQKRGRGSFLFFFFLLFVTTLASLQFHSIGSVSPRTLKIKPFI